MEVKSQFVRWMLSGRVWYTSDVGPPWIDHRHWASWPRDVSMNRLPPRPNPFTSICCPWWWDPALESSTHEPNNYKSKKWIRCQPAWSQNRKEGVWSKWAVPFWQGLPIWIQDLNAWVTQFLKLPSDFRPLFPSCQGSQTHAPVSYHRGFKSTPPY